MHSSSTEYDLLLPNAGPQPRLEAGARYERTLFSVRSMPLFGLDLRPALARCALCPSGETIPVTFDRVFVLPSSCGVLFDTALPRTPAGALHTA